MDDGILIALYRGASPISRVIKWATRSPYSHAAMVDARDGTTWEAWHVNPQGKMFGGYFRESPSPWTLHEPGTPVEFYAVHGMTPEIAAKIRATCRDWAAKRIPYDYVQILRFLIRSQRGGGPVECNRLFCSEADVIAFRLAGLPILLGPASRTPPHLLEWSPIRYRVHPAWVPPVPA